MQSELTRRSLNLLPGDHLCLFYDSDPAEQMPALLPFIEQALAAGEQFIYIADDQTIDELSAILEQGGVDVARECDRGALKLWTRRDWRQPGRLSADKKSRQVLQMIDDAAKSGFKASRFAVEMTWTLGPEISTRLLEQWEARLNTIFVPGFPGKIVCQYNRSRLSSDAIVAALRTHPMAILGDELYSNLFYEAPLILYGNRTSSRERVEWMLSQLKGARAAEKEREELIRQGAALAAAERSRKEIEAVLALMPAAVYTCDADGKISYYNRRAAELWGREPATGDTGERFCGSQRAFYPDGRPLPPADLPAAQVLHTGAAIHNKEMVIERPDRSRITVTVNSDAVKSSDGAVTGAISVFEDVTEQRELFNALSRKEQELGNLNQELERRVRQRTIDLEISNAALLRDIEERRTLEEQLRQAQKMESIGTLAGGIAHDFNNILNIIQGYSSLLATHAAENSEIGSSLTVINDAIKRGAAVVQQLLTMARKAEAHLEPTDLNSIVGGLLELLKGTLPKSIDVNVDLADNLPAVMADPNQLNQALLNLCVNARDAMSSGGRLTLKTALVDGGVSNNGGEHAAEQFAALEVSDSGTGMDEDIRNRVFEPFFTTKDSDKGTGLGLSVVYGIVKNHRGTIDVKSAPGSGAMFRILLPIASAEDFEAARDGADRNGVNHGDARSATALVVEDEEAVLHLLRNLLAERGYRVLTAMDGEEATARYRRSGDDIDVVLLDMDLPKISGAEVLRKIRARNPHARVVVTSGYLEPELKAALAREGVSRFIPKPYIPEEIIAALEAEENPRFGTTVGTR